MVAMSLIIHNWWTKHKAPVFNVVYFILKLPCNSRVLSPSSVCVCVCVWARALSVTSKSLWPMDCSLPAPLSLEFPRQEHWRGLPFPFPGVLPDPGIKLRSPALQMDSLLTEPPGKPIYSVDFILFYLFIWPCCAACGVLVPPHPCSGSLES